MCRELWNPIFVFKKKSLRNAYIELILRLAYKSANHFCQPRALSVHAKQTLHKEVPIPPPLTGNLGSPVRTKREWVPGYLGSCLTQDCMLCLFHRFWSWQNCLWERKRALQLEEGNRIIV